MKRRDFLLAGAGAGLVLNPVGQQVLAATATNACFASWAKGTKMVSWKKKAPPYRMALSNSYIGNMWRTEMVNIAKLYSERPEVKPLLKSFQISSAGNDVSAQIAQLNQMILSGVDAIVIDAASPTGLNSTIDQAVNAGILVVSIDNVVSTDKAIVLEQDETQMGEAWAKFIIEKVGQKGDILMVRGVAGTTDDTERTDGGKAVFSKYPGIKITEVYGRWDSGTAQKVTADALAAAGHPFDGVWSQGGDDGVIRAFEAAGYKIPPIAGEAENGFRAYAAAHQLPILSIGQSAAGSAHAMMVALQMLQGHAMPQHIKAENVPVRTQDLKEGENYYKGVPDSFFCGISIPSCGLEFDAHDILSIKV